MKLIFHLKNNTSYKCDSDNLIGVFNNPLVEMVDVPINGCLEQFILKNSRFIFYSKDNKHFIGRQKKIKGANIKFIYEIGGSGLIPVVV